MLARRAFAAAERVAEGGIVLLVCAMVVVCLAQVFWRYALGDPLIWSEEAARYLFVWVSYLSGWLAWKHRRHIALDVVHHLGGAGIRRFSDRLVEVVVLGFCTYTFWTNLTLLSVTARQPSAVLGVPMAWIYAGYSTMVFLIAADILIGWLSPRREQADAAP